MSTQLHRSPSFGKVGVRGCGRVCTYRKLGPTCQSDIVFFFDTVEQDCYLVVEAGVVLMPVDLKMIRGESRRSPSTLLTLSLHLHSPTLSMPSKMFLSPPNTSLSLPIASSFYIFPFCLLYFCLTDANLTRRGPSELCLDKDGGYQGVCIMPYEHVASGCGKHLMHVLTLVGHAHNKFRDSNKVPLELNFNGRLIREDFRPNLQNWSFVQKIYITRV